MEFESYFEPVNSAVAGSSGQVSATLGQTVKLFTPGSSFPDIAEADIVIIGVPEERGSLTGKGCAEAPDVVREKLYRLKLGSHKLKIADLGNLRPGHGVNDTYAALAGIVEHLVRNNVCPLILGGSQDLTFAQYKAYEKFDYLVNIVSMDARFDLGQTEDPLHNNTYLGKIVLHQPNHLFNFSNLGFQTYFEGHESVQMMEKLYFDVYRLGQVRTDMEDAEPIVRNADIFTFDISSIRQSDAPGGNDQSPNGFYGEEACQIMRYAGMSDKLSSIGFYEITPSMDRNGQTAGLVAQMIWYFIDGYYSRMKDLPVTGKSGFVKYHVTIRNTEHEIIFYKSTRSDRWWMEVPYPSNMIKFQKQHIIPCSYKDYQLACQEEMPERWWQAFQKMS